jgi:hypothetical protein
MRPIGEALAQALLERHKQVCRPRNRTTATVTDQDIRESIICYGDLCRMAHPSCPPRGVGPFLSEIAKWCSDQCPPWPPLSSLAVNKRTRVPGCNYPGRDWDKEVRECIAFKNYPDKR